MSDYYFNNMGRIGYDSTDGTQRNLQNTRFANYTLSSFFSDKTANDTIQFAVQQPTMNMSGYAVGNGLSGKSVDYESMLYMNTEQERPLEKLNLTRRPFLTVPYLGRGSCDPTLESQLLQGELVSERKSVSTVMDKSFMPYTLQPDDVQMKEFAENPKNSIQEYALDGWTRGGVPTREIPQNQSQSQSQNMRPSW
jgi:hypothetical protein